MNAPNGLIEELALERAAIVEHEQRATELWNARLYAGAQNERAAAREARKRVRELEAKLTHAIPTGMRLRALEGD